jgi:hypothetical protein
MTTELERRLAALPDGPPGPGRTVSPQDGGAPTYWLLDGTPADGAWAAWAQRFPVTGLWPLLVRGLHHDPQRPWTVGEVRGADRLPAPLPDLDEVLARLWAGGVPEDDDEDEEDVLMPFGPTWPGTAPAGSLVAAPEQVAARVAREILHDRGVPGVLVAPPCGFALVAVDRGADVVDAVGWWGAANHDPKPGDFTVVLRSWEERFAARVVGLGFDTLDLAVAAPPQDRVQAEAVAAEHFAFCSDNVLQGAGGLREYAAELVGATTWSFWWD